MIGEASDTDIVPYIQRLVKRRTHTESEAISVVDICQCVFLYVKVGIHYHGNIKRGIKTGGQAEAAAASLIPLCIL